jgi:hypothetical protein
MRVEQGSFRAKDGRDGSRAYLPRLPDSPRPQADLRSRGIDLETDGARLRWRPAFMVTGPLAEAVQAHKGELVRLLTGPDCLERCPACRWPLDSKRRCPKCLDRLCVDCGRLTASYFVMRCLVCGLAFQE